MLLSPFGFCLLALFCSGITASFVTFKNGSYRDILVAFDAGRIRSEEQIKKLEKLIKDASRVLYDATDGLAHFKEVRIILAHEEQDLGRGDKIADRSRIYSRADIRIGSPKAEYGTRDVFTLQTGECGEKGKFIFLSDSFINNLDSENATKFAARRLVQEWVRYRYGVFDEQESFQWEGEEISPGTCVDGIQGWAMTENHERCVLECERVGSNCRFFPDIKNNSGVESSLMSFPELPDVKFFCNSSNHNERALSMQNSMCGARSIMEIIQKHEDFKNAHRSGPEETDVNRTFDKDRFLDIIFIVEPSEVMKQENWTQEARHIIDRFFMHFKSKRIPAYFIKFAEASKQPMQLVGVGTNLDWQNHQTPNVSTAARTLLGPSDMGYPLDWVYYVEVKPYYSWKDEKILTIHSITLGRTLNPTWKLDPLTQMNGGDSYFLGDARSGIREPRVFNLEMAFFASMHEVADDHELPVTIRYDRLTLESNGEHYNHSFQVDDGIGKDLVITFSPNYTMHKLFNPHLDSPPEKNYSYRYDSIAKGIVVDDAEPGRWKLELWQDPKQEEEHVDVMITAKPRVDLQGNWVWVRAWIANVTEDKKGNGTKGYHRIYAKVKKRSIPVMNATVVATVQIMDQKDPINVTLKDNGAAPDVFKDDGIYSNFFPVTNRKAGRPIVIVRVTNENRTAWVKIPGPIVIRKGKIHGGNARVKTADSKKSGTTRQMLDDADRQRATKKFGTPKSRFSRKDFVTRNTTGSYCQETNEAEKICAVPLPLFERVAMANSPILFPIDETEVLRIPPAAVRDLKVLSEFMKRGEFFAVLQWTSPEHPRPKTKVKRFESCCSMNPSLVTLKNCLLKNAFTLDHVEHAGEVQQFEAKISEFLVEDPKGKVHNVYLTMRGRDDKGNAGDLSNIAEAFFERTDVGKETEAAKRKLEPTKGETGSPSWVPWTVGVVVVAVVVVAIAVVIAIGYLKWKKKNKGWMPNARETFQLKESEHSR